MTGSSLNYSYYDILEVSPHCPQHEITTAYEKAKHTYATDNPAIYTMFNEEEARELLKMVEEAYSVLGNKTLRAIYDEKIGQKRPHSDLTFTALQAESKAVFSEMPKKIVPQVKIEFQPDDNLEQEIKIKAEWSGPDLKKIREYKKFSLEKISEVTKISSYYINAIESMDTAGLPAAVFVRGYVSQISKVLGLDDKRVCDSYMKYFKSAIEKK
jgi:DnaJ-class molecular chaperone